MRSWGILKTSLCCQPPLTLISKSLARRFNSTNSSIFLDSNQWSTCSHPSIFQSQNASVNSHVCNFKNFFKEAADCAALSIDGFKTYKAFNEASALCGRFDQEYHSFDDICRNCSQAVLKARDSLMKQNGNKTEKEVCGIAVVTALASQTSLAVVDDFYGCLRSLDVHDNISFGLPDSVFQTLLGIVLASMALMFVIMLVKYVMRKKQQANKSAQLHTKEIPTAWSGLYSFSKAEIEHAIYFSGEKQCLGRGSAGEVYKGILPSGQVVAIKQISNRNNADSFTREVEGLSRIRHPNLVCLFGCCTEDGKDCVLPWEKRVKILRDCALAIRFLHHFIDGCIVHRDIKAKDVNLGRRPLTDFEDPRLKGNLNTVDFESILQIAVLCVAKSSKGRPTIDVVFGEMDKAWQNTLADMRAKKEMKLFTSTQPLDVKVI
ncbi:hypothetical protein M8C21_031784 [Ambrosia artemisiifolia]|uniref:Protein kinase domain-containing protein n=1 Tax=Ambrosia artemisiifolia TaxID=4212 RepID=A0AAD5CN37_AMBAR|nr:hypothetical protein M8C21_031784 [Ambrosia artemisiifolia]